MRRVGKDPCIEDNGEDSFVNAYTVVDISDDPKYTHQTSPRGLIVVWQIPGTFDFNTVHTNRCISSVPAIGISKWTSTPLKPLTRRDWKLLVIQIHTMVLKVSKLLAAKQFFTRYVIKLETSFVQMMKFLTTTLATPLSANGRFVLCNAEIKSLIGNSYRCDDKSKDRERPCRQSIQLD